MLTDSCVKSYPGSVLLSGESVGAYGISAQTIAALSGGEVPVRFLPMDETARALVRNEFGTELPDNPEAYVICADKDVAVYAASPRAQLYAACSIAGKYRPDGLPRGVYFSYPAVKHRSARVYLPAKRELPYFRSFIDLLVKLGYNALILEIGGALEYRRHPEINETWKAYCESMLEFNDKCYVAQRVYYRPKDSVHIFNGMGDIYTHEEMRELVRYCRDRHLSVIPEVASLSHSEYFLISHPELRECDDEPFASAACPSNPALYSLLYDLYDEVLEVFEPEIVSIGHDEWRTVCVCDKCRGKDPARLFAEDVQKCYDYLAARGVKVMMWADGMIGATDQFGENVAGSEKHILSVPTDRVVNVMGEEHVVYNRIWHNHPEEALKNGFMNVVPDTTASIDMIPEDVICLNWVWQHEPRMMDALLRTGRPSILGNCRPAAVPRMRDRFNLGVQGLSISNWLDSSESGMQRWSTLFNLGYGAVQCWNHDRTELDHERNLFETFHGLFALRNAETLRGRYLEVVHTLTRLWQPGEAYYKALPFAEPEKMTVGEYLVTYDDGSQDSFPVVYSLNIGPESAKTERGMSARCWAYELDAHLTVTAAVCDIQRDGDSIFYRTVFPLRQSVRDCAYLPREGLEGLVSIQSIRVR